MFWNRNVKDSAKRSANNKTKLYGIAEQELITGAKPFCYISGD